MEDTGVTHTTIPWTPGMTDRTQPIPGSVYPGNNVPSTPMPANSGSIPVGR